MNALASIATCVTPTEAAIETQPTAVGVIIGTIEPAKLVQGIFALDRQRRVIRAGQWDAATGRFRVGGLTPHRRYDLRIATQLGILEGVDLRPREPLAAPKPPSAEPLCEEDKQQINRLIRSVERFEDQVRMLFLRGTDRYATALVEKLRTRPFHGMRGEEIIWRVEIWYFTWQYGGWQREANVERVLVRKRMLRRDFEHITWVFDPALGGIVAAPKDTAKPVGIKLGIQFDRRFGRLSRTFNPKLLPPATCPAPQTTSASPDCDAAPHKTATTKPASQLSR